MMFPFNNKLRIWAAQTSDYTYLWLLIHEPRDDPWREMGDLHMQGLHPGKLPESRGVWLGKG